MYESLLTHQQHFSVKYIGKNNRGKHSLSRKAVLEERNGKKPSGGEKKAPNSKENQEAKMSKEEVDVIAQAIEGVSEL